MMHCVQNVLKCILSLSKNDALLNKCVSVQSQGFLDEWDAFEATFVTWPYFTLFEPFRSFASFQCFFNSWKWNCSWRVWNKADSQMPWPIQRIRKFTYIEVSCLWPLDLQLGQQDFFLLFHRILADVWIQGLQSIQF